MLYERINKAKSTNPHIWIHLRDRSELLKDAQSLALRYAGKPLPTLYGVPFAIKDNFDVSGLATTAACAAYSYVPSDTAPAVSALLEAGALLIGKTNMDQLATGLSGCRSPFGTPASVYGQSQYISGGSSSGSGVAVGADLVSFSLGTDTAGSGRVPAALNGIVGFKPTKGTISARGVVPACKSLDTVSVFAKSTSDAREVWQVMDQYDSEDAYAKLPSVLPVKAADYRGISKAGFSVMVPPASALQLCSADFRTMFEEAVFKLEKSGGRPIRLSEEEYQPFQTATELLYSGSLVSERIACIGHDFIANNLDSLHPTTRSLFSAVLSRDAKPWDVFSDQIEQAECTRKAQRLFKRADVMLLPSVPFHPTIAEMAKDPVKLNAQMGEFTHFANVLDLCAISIDATFYEGSYGRMPFGISLVAGMGLDGLLLDIAAHVERSLAEH
jgi:allophanate hydrolase